MRNVKYFTLGRQSANIRLALLRVVWIAVPGADR